MKTQLRYSFFLLTFFLISFYQSYGQASISDDAVQKGDGLSAFREKVADAVQMLIEKIDASLESYTYSRSDAITHSDDSSSLSRQDNTQASEDSTRKSRDLRQAQDELRKELEELKSKTKELEARLQKNKSDGRSHLEADLRRMQKDINKLQKKLEKIQQKAEKYRRGIEDKYIGDSKNVTRFNSDLTIGRDEVIDGDVVLTNGDAFVEGKINGKLVVTNGDVNLGDSAVVEGDVVCVNGDVNKKEGARIKGNIVENTVLSFTPDYEKDDEEDLSNSFYQRYPNSISSVFPLRSPLEESFLRYNRAEGLYLGAAQAKKLYWVSQPWIVGTGSLGYGFASHTWRYSLGLYKPFYLENQIIEFGGEGHSLTDSKDQWIVGREENSVMAFFAREDFMDYFTRKGYSVSLGWFGRFDQGLQTRVNFLYQHDTYRSMNKMTDWSMFGGDKIFRDNPQINESNINSIYLTAGLSTVSKVWKQIEGWDIHAAYEIAGGATKGDYDFTQSLFDVRRYQPLGEYVNLNLRARAGASSGTLPLQRTFDLGGISTLPGYRFKEFFGSHVVLINTEIILHSSFADNSRGWVSWLFRGINIILFADAGVTNTPDFTSGSIDASFSDGFTSLTKNQLKTDAGFAIGSSDGDFRIGLAWRLDKAHSPNLIVRFTRPF